MTKGDLIHALAEKEGLKGKEACDIVNFIVKRFIRALKEGGRLEIRGFGSFSVRGYGAYTGRNPKTGAKTQVGPKRLPFFRVGKELKVRANG